MGRKILFYTHAFGGGGAEIVFARLATAFADAGEDVVHVADFEGPVALVRHRGIRRIMLGAGHLQATRRLAAVLYQEKPDASFSALGAQNLKHLAAALLVGRSSRCVLGYHGFAGAEPKRLSRLSFRATPLITRMAARTICVSDTLLENVRSQWGGSPARTMRIYNPVPSADPDIATTDKAEPPLVLAVGRLVPIKRFHDLLAAVARLPTAHLAILGDGPERAAIEAEARNLGIADRIELPGHVADPGPWYRRAACLAITSESESFGLTAAEALAHGTPVVSTDCGGPAEILANGRHGRLVPVGDIEAIAAALAATLAEPGDPAGRLRRADDFAIPAIHRAYADLIASLP